MLENRLFIKYIYYCMKELLFKILQLSEIIGIFNYFFQKKSVIFWKLRIWEFYKTFIQYKSYINCNKINKPIIQNNISGIFGKRGNYLCEICTIMVYL